MLVSGNRCLLVHLLVDIRQELLHCATQAIPRGLELLAGVSHNDLDFARLNVASSELQSDRRAAHLPLVELVARVMRVAVIDGHAQTCFTQLSSDLMGLGGESRRIVLLLSDRDDDKLSLGDLRRQDQSLVIRVDHNHGANRAS